MDFAKVLESQLTEATSPPPLPPEPTGPVPMDLEGIRQALSPYHEQVAAMVEEAQALKVEDEVSNTRATELGNIARTIKKAVESIKNEPIYLEADALVKGVRNLIKSFTDPLENQVERPLKDKISSYQEHLRLEQQRRQAAAREEARRQQEKIDAEAKALREEAERKAREAEAKLKKEKDESARLALQKTIEEERVAAQAPIPQVVAAVVSPPTEKVTRTAAGSSFQKRPWKAFLVDESKVEREFLIVDMVAVNRAVKAGRREIPGFEVRQVTDTSFRG